jgi:hypothetical protein
MIRSAAVILLLFAAVPAHAGFNEILGDLQSRLGHTMWIPFFGVVRSVVRIGHPRGVHDLQLAVFEGKGRIDPQVLDQLMMSRAGRGYSPLVRVRSRREKEASFIYARPLGENIELLVLTNDGDDTVLVRVVVDPDAVGKYLESDPKSVGLIARP